MPKQRYAHDRDVKDAVAFRFFIQTKHKQMAEFEDKHYNTLTSEEKATLREAMEVFAKFLRKS